MYGEVEVTPRYFKKLENICLDNIFLWMSYNIVVP